MEAVAHSKFARYSYRKVNQVLGLIRGKSVNEAMGVLQWVPRVSRVLVGKTLKSAFSNAGRGIDPDQIYIQEAWANNGPVLKRVRPMAMGARAIYKRKMCHLTIKVSDQVKRRK